MDALTIVKIMPYMFSFLVAQAAKSRRRMVMGIEAIVKFCSTLVVPGTMTRN